jgi:hypothetical protein
MLIRFLFESIKIEMLFFLREREIGNKKIENYIL